jgi:hypothetical protein
MTRMRLSPCGSNILACMIRGVPVHVPTANGRGHTVKKSRRNGETEGEYRRRVRQEKADPDTEPEVERG